MNPLPSEYLLKQNQKIPPYLRSRIGTGARKRRDSDFSTEGAPWTYFYANIRKRSMERWVVSIECSFKEMLVHLLLLHGPEIWIDTREAANLVSDADTGLRKWA